MWANPYIERLNKGERVSFKPQGRSMEPHIKSGQLVTVVPCDKYEVNDIVLCEMDNGSQYLHFIDWIKDDNYMICNARGRINGWTKKVYGKVV